MAIDLETLTAGLAALDLLHASKTDKQLAGLQENMKKALEAQEEKPDPAPIIKGDPVRVWDQPQAYNGLSQHAVDMRRFNAATVQVIVMGGTGPSVTITVKGSSAQGANFDTLEDPNATKTAVAANTSFDVLCGPAFLRVELSSISGTFGNGQGYLVIVTPYVAAGPVLVKLQAGTASVGTVVLGAGSAIAAKVGIDQTTPGTTNGVQVNAALPAGTNAIGKLAANSGVDIGDVDVKSAVVSSVTAAKLAKTKQPRASKTCTNADSDYAFDAAIPSGTTYVVLYADNAAVVALGEATSATVGVFIGGGNPAVYPVVVSGTAADDTLHVQSPTAGTVVWASYIQD